MRWVRKDVGRGGSVASLDDAFVASPSHYENLIDPGFDAIEVGVTVAEDGTIYAAQEFMERPESSATLSSAPSEGQRDVPPSVLSTVTPAREAPVRTDIGGLGRSKATATPGLPAKERTVIHPAAAQLMVDPRDMAPRFLVATFGLMALGSVLTLVLHLRRSS